eukprot:3819354-Pyramimonas_sp.AAC.1
MVLVALEMVYMIRVGYSWHNIKRVWHSIIPPYHTYDLIVDTLLLVRRTCCHLQVPLYVIRRHHQEALAQAVEKARVSAAPASPAHHMSRYGGYGGKQGQPKGGGKGYSGQQQGGPAAQHWAPYPTAPYYPYPPAAPAAPA